jgi:hypothetical protein
MYCYYLFRPTAAIIRYIQPLQSPFFCLLNLLTLASVYTLGLCPLGILFVYVMSICYEIY